MQQSELEMCDTELRAELCRAGYLLDRTLDHAQLGVQGAEQVVQTSLLRRLHEGMLEKPQRLVIAVLRHRLECEARELLRVEPCFVRFGLCHGISFVCRCCPSPFCFGKARERRRKGRKRISE